MEHLVPLNTTVTLDNIYFHFLKKILPGAEDLVSLSKESPDQLLGTGTRGINGDHQFLQTIHFFVFQRLDQRQISILLHSKIIKKYNQNYPHPIGFLPWEKQIFGEVSDNHIGFCTVPPVPLLYFQNLLRSDASAAPFQGWYM